MGISRCNCLPVCRRKKPAWATTGPAADDVDEHDSSSTEESSSDKTATQHAQHEGGSDAESALAAVDTEADNDTHVTRVQQPHAAVRSKFGADNAASAAVTTAASGETHTHKDNSHEGSNSHAALSKPHTSSSHPHMTSPRQGSVAKGSSSNSLAGKHHATGDANAKSAPSQMTFEEMLQRFQEPTLGSILRDSTIADDSARKLAKKAARAADDALPPFITTSSSPHSTSRQHTSLNTTGSKSRPASASSSMSTRQFDAELRAMHTESGEARPLFVRFLIKHGPPQTTDTSAFVVSTITRRSDLIFMP